MGGVVHHRESSILAETLDAAKATEAAGILETAYPGHPWRVGYQGHVITIHHDQVEQWVKAQFREFGRGFCYSINWNNYPDAKVFKQQVLKGGGAMLEGFGIPRGKWVGVEPRYIPGVFTQVRGVFERAS